MTIDVSRGGNHGGPHRGGRATIIGAACLLGLAACAHTSPSIYGGPGVASTAGTPWVAPPKVVEQDRAAAKSIGRTDAGWTDAGWINDLPDSIRTVLLSNISSRASIPDSLRPTVRLDLAQIVDIALRSSAETRAAWAGARSAAAAYGSKRGDYLPDVNAGANLTRQKAPAVGDKPSLEQRTYGGSADLTWLLFNFGGRKAAIEETRQALLAANWTHNATIQNVVLKVEQAYYQYIAAQALWMAEKSTLEETGKNLESAEERHKAGLATIAEVLQARTALSQVQLAVESLDGQIQVTRGALVTAMGLPANIPIDVELPPLQLPMSKVSDDVEQYLQSAAENRPDLAAARANVSKAEAHLRTVRAAGLPSLSTAGSLGRVYRDNPDKFSNTYSASIQLRFPLFTGFSHDYDMLQAKADAEATRARLQATEQAVVLQVWTSYYSYRTAERRLGVIEDLLKSASESHDVALGRYQAGVGSILELLVAQAALEDARAQQVKARSDYFISVTQLAHDTGTLEASGNPARNGVLGAPQKEQKP